MTPYVVIASAGVAAIAATAWITASEYKNLPDRVPMQFWFDGKPTSFGPRPVIWIIVAVQVLCVATFAFTHRTLSGTPTTHKHVLGMDLFGLCIMAMLGYAQTMIVEAAKSSEQRLPMPRYWLSLLVFMAAAIVCASLF